jgi:uncharacterized membrane protein
MSKDTRHPMLTWGVKRGLLVPERMLLVVGTLAGGLFLYTYPPLSGPDEPNHFRRAYQVSEGTILGERQGKYAGGYLPRDLLDTRLELKSDGRTGNSPPDFLSDVPGRAFVDFRNTVPYTPIPYIPHAIAIAAGRLFGVSPLALHYLARLGGLVAALAGLWLVIRITPTAKWLFVVLALTPMAIRQMSTVTADTVTHVSAFLLLAICLRLALDPEAKLRGGLLVGLFGCALALSLSKQAYLPMLLLYFLCPAHKSGSHKRHVALFAALALLCVGAQATWFLASWDLYVPQPIAPEADPAQQMLFILKNPIRYTAIVLNNLWNHRIDYPGGAFGYGGIVSRPTSMPLALGLMLLALVCAGRPATLGLKAKVLLAVTGACTVTTVLTMNYLGWNTVGASTVSYVQGRYFIPVLPLGLLLVGSRYWRFLSDRPIALLATLVASVSGIATVVANLQ